MEIPGYDIEKQIGKGGMAGVYLALHKALDRKVAIKVMNRQTNMIQITAHAFYVKHVSLPIFHTPTSLPFSMSANTMVTTTS